jgi:hypothetical protein
MDHDIYINEDGSIQHIYDDELVDLFDGETTLTGNVTRRASHVEPFGFGWLADMRPVGGPVLFDTNTANPLGRVAFKTRAAALAAERAWLNAQMESRKI